MYSSFDTKDLITQLLSMRMSNAANLEHGMEITCYQKIVSSRRSRKLIQHLLHLCSKIVKVNKVHSSSDDNGFLR